MGCGLESHSVGRVYSVDGAVQQSPSQQVMEATTS